MLDRSALNELSAAFADRLFHKYPQWEHLAKNLQDGPFEVSVPQPGADRYLLISTQDDEITIGYDYWHDHLGSFLGLSDKEVIDQGMEEIRAIIEEDLVVMISFRDDKWVQSMHWRPATPVITEPGGTTQLRSWLGTYDRVLEGIPRLIP
jgi:hypothetical protein